VGNLRTEMGSGSKRNGSRGTLENYTHSYMPKRAHEARRNGGVARSPPKQTKKTENLLTGPLSSTSLKRVKGGIALGVEDEGLRGERRKISLLKIKVKKHHQTQSKRLGLEFGLQIKGLRGEEKEGFGCPRAETPSPKNQRVSNFSGPEGIM